MSITEHMNVDSGSVSFASLFVSSNSGRLAEDAVMEESQASRARVQELIVDQKVLVIHLALSGDSHTVRMCNIQLRLGKH